MLEILAGRRLESLHTDNLSLFPQVRNTESSASPVLVFLFVLIYENTQISVLSVL